MATERNPVFSELHGYFVKDAYARERISEEQAARLETEKKVDSIGAAAGLVETFRPYPTFTIPKTTHTGTDDYYGVQGCCSTNDSIIIAEIANDNTNLNCKLSKIDQSSYNVVNSFERTLSQANHMNCLTYYDVEDEVWAIGTGQTAYIIDAATLDFKRNEATPIASNAMGYDKLSGLWMFTRFTSNQCTVYLYERESEGVWNEVNHFTINRMSTTQGAAFNDGIIYLVFSENGAGSTYQTIGNENFNGMQNIVAVNIAGEILRSWWCDADYVEFEDCDILSNGKMVVSSNKTIGDGTTYTIYTGIYKHIDNNEELSIYDRDYYFNAYWLYPYYTIKSTDSHLDLANEYYLRPFTYAASTAVANAMTNLPKNSPFKMVVESALGPYGGVDISKGYQYIRRTFITLSDDVYVQYCSSNAAGVWTFGPWIKQPRPFKPGETIANADYFVYGFITGSGREVNLIFPIGKSIENVTSAVCEYCRCAVRSVAGTYLGGQTNIDLTEYVTLVELHKEQNAIMVRLWNDNGWDITNNTPLVGACRGRFVLS